MQCDRMSNVEFRFVGTGWYRASMEMFLRMYVFVFQRPPPCVHLRGFPDKQNSMGLRIHTHRDRCTYICMCTICCVLFAAHWILNSGASPYRRRTPCFFASVAFRSAPRNSSHSNWREHASMCAGDYRYKFVRIDCG